MAKSELGREDKSRVPDALPEYKCEDPRTVASAPSEPLPSHARSRSAPPAPHGLPTDLQVPAYGLVPGPVAPGFQGSSAESDTLVSRGTAIQQLRQLVEIFASQLDGFSAERSTLKATLAAKAQVS